MNNKKKKFTQRMRKLERIVDEELISKKWIIYTGGQDVHGCPLLTFPVEQDSNATYWTADGLMKLLTYMTDIVELVMKRKSIAFVSSLQYGITDERMTMLVHALQMLETERPGTVAALYILKPKSKSKIKTLKKLLGLRKKKDQVSFISQFKTMLLKSLEELHTQIEPSQLTEDYGGKLPYDHNAWIFFDRMVLPNLAEAEEVLEKTKDVRDKVLLLQEYDILDHSSRRLQKFRCELNEKYSTLIGESGIVSSIEKCKQTLHMLDQTTEDNILINLHQTLVMEVVTRVRFIYGQLTDTRREFDHIWEQVDGDITTEIRIEYKKEEANKLCNEISERYWPMMARHPTIPVDMSQAEIYRTHFNTTLFEPAKALINKATLILQQLREIQLMYKQRPHSVKDIVLRLSNTIHPFTQQLNNLNEIYVSLHVFFFVFQKIKEWYQRVLDFMPNSLCSRAMTVRDNSSVFAAPVDWCRSVQRFQRKHPPPRSDHMALVADMDSVHVNESVRSQAKVIAYRCRIMLSLLGETYLDIGMLKNVFLWKKEQSTFLNDEQDIYVNSMDNFNHHPQKMPKDTRLSRRISRSKSMKGSQPRNLPGFRDCTPLRNYRMGRKFSSTDTEPQNSVSSGPPERFISLNSSFEEQDNSPETQFSDVFPTPRPPALNPYGIAHISRKSSFRSDWSLHSSPDHRSRGDKSGYILDYIKRVTTASSLNSEKKIQYVSDLLSSFDFDDVEEEDYLENGVYRTASTLPARNREARRRGTDPMNWSPAQTICELNKRLSRSLDNVFGIELLPDVTCQPESSPPSLQARSLVNVCESIDENDIWRSIETTDSIQTHSRCSSWKSGENEDTEPSSRSNEDTDDVDDTAPVTNIQRHRPSRINIRRKRRSFPSENDADSRPSMISPGVFRRNSDLNHQRSNIPVNLSAPHADRGPLMADIKRRQFQKPVSLDRTTYNGGEKKSIWSLSTDNGYDSSKDHHIPESHAVDYKMDAALASVNSEQADEREITNGIISDSKLSNDDTFIEVSSTDMNVDTTATV